MRLRLRLRLRLRQSLLRVKGLVPVHVLLFVPRTRTCTCTCTCTRHAHSMHTACTRLRAEGFVLLLVLLRELARAWVLVERLRNLAHVLGAAHGVGIEVGVGQWPGSVVSGKGQELESVVRVRVRVRVRVG